MTFCQGGSKIGCSHDNVEGISGVSGSLGRGKMGLHKHPFILGLCLVHHCHCDIQVALRDVGTPVVRPSLPQ